MIVKIDKSLEKDISKIKEKEILKKLHQIIVAFQKATSLNEISNIKKLKGAKNFYRIRMGDYRLGLIVQNKTVQFIRLLHRKEIYRFFP